MFQKSSLSRIVDIFGSLKTMSSSGTKFSLGFSFSMTLSSSLIRRSPDNVWVVFFPTSLCLFNLKDGAGGRGGGGGGGFFQYQLLELESQSQGFALQNVLYL